MIAMSTTWSLEPTRQDRVRALRRQSRLLLAQRFHKRRHLSAWTRVDGHRPARGAA